MSISKPLSKPPKVPWYKTLIAAIGEAIGNVKFGGS